MTGQHGTDRTDDQILALDEPAREIFIQAVYYGWMMSGPLTASMGRHLAERHHNPSVGDLVIVPDSLVHDRPTLYGLGYLVLECKEPVYSDEEWLKVADQYEGQPPPEEKVFYIQHGPDAGDVCRWTNATLLVVPTQALYDELRDAARSNG
jgi:hypothetical protein